MATLWVVLFRTSPRLSLRHTGGGGELCRLLQRDLEISHPLLSLPSRRHRRSRLARNVRLFTVGLIRSEYANTIDQPLQETSSAGNRSTTHVSRHPRPCRPPHLGDTAGMWSLAYTSAQNAAPARWRFSPVERQSRNTLSARCERTIVLERQLVLLVGSVHPQEWADVGCRRVDGRSSGSSCGGFKTAAPMTLRFLQGVLAGSDLKTVLERGDQIRGNTRRPSRLATASRRRPFEVAALGGNNTERRTPRWLRRKGRPPHFDDDRSRHPCFLRDGPSARACETP